MIEKIKELLNKSEYNFDDLCAVMEILRSEGGCPWDREQTHESIRQNFIEETYEVCEAIDNSDAKLLREELGDVMLQVVFHAQIEKEKGVFDIDGVASDIVKKLIYRHPHIFASTVADTTDVVLENWEALKAKEKHRETTTDTLKSIPKQFPALMRAQKVGKKAAKVGFDFEDVHSATDKVYEELDELFTASEEDRFEEMGDLLFAVVNTSRKLGIDAELALSRATDKFINRFSLVEDKIAKDGKDMSKMNIEEMDIYWDKAKIEQSSVK